MKLIDITEAVKDITLVIYALGLIYFMIDSIKYSNRNVYYRKLERLNELRKLITAIENENKDTEEIIKSVNADNFYYDDKQTNKLIKYRDNKYILSDLKDEQRKIEKYIKKAHMYERLNDELLGIYRIHHE